jgi:CO/xanthine dehydrogenase Mo-binding subunit
LQDRLAAAPPPEGAGRGVAYAQYKNAQGRVAVGADVLVGDDARPRVARLLLVADAGRIVDPDGLRAQIEGGAIQATGWALSEGASWDRDGVTTRSWDDARPLRFPDAPEVETVLLEPPGAPSVGAGEAACGPVVAAIANAIHAASGLRLTTMPFDADALRAAALA